MSTIVGQFDDVAQRFGDNTAVVQCLNRSRSINITFSELDRRSNYLASYLVSLGIRSGDLVGIYMRRSIDHIVAILGILKTGAGFYTLNPQSTVGQITHAVSAASTKVIIADNNAAFNLRALSSQSSMAATLALYSTEAPSVLHEDLFRQIGQSVRVERVPFSDRINGDSRIARRPILGDDVALVLFTSGSTGTPKGVIVSHRDLYNRAATECECYKIGGEDVLLNVLPFSFDVGANQFFTALMRGASLIILNSWLPTDLLSAIQSHRVTGISGVPAIWAPLLDIEESDVRNSMKSVRYITISGGDLAPNQLQRLGDLVGPTQIFKTYGQSETFRSAMLLPSEYRSKMLSVGRPIKGTEILIVKSDGQHAGANEEGEIIHLGDGIMLGYLGDEKGTNDKIRSVRVANGNGDYRRRAVYTGDIGKIDDDGYLYVLGRKDSMIKTSGYRVYPSEIASHILRHPNVKDVAVFGIPDLQVGTAICSEVELKPLHSLTETELKTFLSDKLPVYMIPRKIVIVASFPRTASGKISLAEVAAKYRA